jgi:ABC-type branched-subunit amino acid transport system ATPase component
MNLAVRAPGLVKRYGETLAVDGLDLDVTRGDRLGLLGPNGAIGIVLTFLSFRQYHKRFIAGA